jgi:aspartate carbamoyltransferase catalytic subunit
MHDFPLVLESIKDLNKSQIESLLHSANRLKYGYVPIGPRNIGQKFRPIIATSFLENSTRTKHSFAIAIQKLGAMYIDFNADTSSLKKGENLEETLITLRCQGVDVCIIRTSISHELEQFKNSPPIQIINGGDGINQHPTQALLDLFTMFEEGFNPENKTLAIIGDCLHSRVTHSLMDLIPQFGGKIILCGPKECLPESKDLEKSYPQIKLTTDLEEAIDQSDLLYTLRIQKERHSKVAEYYHSYSDNYGITLKKLEEIKTKKGKEIFVYHPGPCNIGVEINYDLLKSPFYKGYHQVYNSVYMRMAIIKAMLLTPLPAYEFQKHPQTYS